MLFCSSLFAFSATGLPFLLAGFLTSRVTPMSCRMFASAMLCSAGAPSTRQTAGLVAFGGRTSAKSFRSPDSRVVAFSSSSRPNHPNKDRTNKSEDTCSPNTESFCLQTVCYLLRVSQDSQTHQDTSFHQLLCPQSSQSSTNSLDVCLLLR